MRIAVVGREPASLPRAVDLLTPLVDRARAAGIPTLEASACGLLAQALALTGRRDQAIPHARRALAIAEELQQKSAVALFREILAVLESGAEISADAPGSSDPEPRIGAALALAQSGDPAAAIRDLEALADELAAADAPGPEASARVALAQILAGTGQQFLAGIQLRAAFAIAERNNATEAAAQIRAMLTALESGAGGDG